MYDVNSAIRIFFYQVIENDEDLLLRNWLCLSGIAAISNGLLPRDEDR